MMAYLTRPEPEGLPQPKPQELLDLQEQKRKDRLRKTMDEASPFLMNESVDFIERENFAIKGLTDQQLIDLGFSTGSNLQPQKQSYKKLAEIFQQADIDDELEYLFQTSKNNPKGKIQSTLRNVFSKLPEDEKGLKYIASLLGEDVEFVLDMIDDKKILEEMSRTERMQKKKTLKSEKLNKDFGKVENWMLKNASKYSDPDKFKKATINRFGKKNAAIKAMTSGGGNFFSTEFNNDILGYKGRANFVKINKTIGDSIFRTTIYNFNPNVRKAITNEFKSILSGGPAEVQAEARKKIKQSKLFEKFGLTKEIRGPISRLIYKEVGEELYKNLQAFRNPRIGTIDLIRYLEGVVDPKYKGQFKEARIAIEAAGKNEFKKAKEILGRTDKIMLDHKIPSSFIKAGYADPIEYIKVTPATENFNVKIKNKQYDVPIKKLLNKFEKASTPEAKQVIYNQILEKHNNFSKKYGGYLDDVKPSFKDGKIKFSSTATPISKKTDFIKEFTKAGLQTGELKNKEAQNLIKKMGIKPTDNKQIILSKIKKAAIPNKAKALILPIVVGATAITGADLITSSVEAAEGKEDEETKNLLPSFSEAAALTTGAAIGSKATATDPLKGFRRFGKEKAKNLLKTIFKTAGAPTVSAGFAASEILDYKKPEDSILDIDRLDPRNYELQEDPNIKTAGASLLAPEVLGTLSSVGEKGALAKARNILMNPFGKAARAFTPVGLATIGAGAAYDLYKEFERRQALTEEERLEEDLEAQEKYDEMMVGAAEGGRIGFADGPDDPKRRTFMKLMAGIASLPILGKFFKAAKTAKVVKLANSSTTMPDWFPAFVEKAFEKGIVKKIDADIQTAELPELPGIEITKHDDGRVFVSGENEYGKRYEIEYEPPGYEVMDYETGKAVKTKGEFIAQEEVPVNVDPDGNADFDVDVLEDLDQILGPDTRVMEEFATGKKIKEMKSGEFSVGKAESDAERAIEEAAEMAEDID